MIHNMFDTAINEGRQFEDEPRTKTFDDSTEATSSEPSSPSEPIKRQEEGHTKLVVDWVRHAESCANFDSKSISDKVPGDVTKWEEGYEKLGQFFDKSSTRTYSKFTPSGMTASFKYHPNLSFVGMQHAIVLGNSLINTLRDGKLNYNVVCASASARTIMTALLSLRGIDTTIFVVPFISEKLNIMGSFDYQNSPLSVKQIKRIVYFFKDWMANNWVRQFDDIEMITVLSILRRDTSDENITAVIKAIFECYKELTQPKIVYASYDNLVEAIRKYAKKQGKEDIPFPPELQYFRKKFGENIGFAKYITTVRDPMYLRGPKVDLKYLKLYEDSLKHPGVKLEHPSIENFYNDTINKIIQGENIDRLNDVKILAFSHGSLMKEHANVNYENKNNVEHPHNTQIFREIRELIVTQDRGVIQELVSMNRLYYVPMLIRTSYQNFAECNVDICRTEGVKGFINYALFDDNIDNNRYRQMVSWVSTVTPFVDKSILGNVHFYLKPYFKEEEDGSGKTSTFSSIKSIFDRVDTDDVANMTQVAGANYKEKYMKYKNKYLQMKKNK